MELSKIEFGKDIDAPRCIKSVGEPPVQTLDFDELMKKDPIVSESSEEDLDDEFYGSDGYNDEDLDGLDLDNIADVSSIDDLY